MDPVYIHRQIPSPMDHRLGELSGCPLGPPGRGTKKKKKIIIKGPAGQDVHWMSRCRNNIC